MRLVRKPLASLILAEILDAGEDASVNRSAAELREPAFDGIDARGTRRREMNAQPGVVVKESENSSSLVGAAVLEDDLQIQVGRRLLVDLPRESAKLLRAMPLRYPSDDLASGDIESRKEVRGAVPLVIMGATLDLARAHRKQRLCLVQRLDPGLLVDRQHHSVVPRVQGQAYDVDDLLGKESVVTDLEGLQPVRLEVGHRPHLAHLPLRDAGVLGHQSGAPVGGLVRDPLGRQAKDPLDRCLRKLGCPARARNISQSLHPVLPTAPPLEDCRAHHLEPLLNRGRAHSAITQENDPCPLRRTAICAARSKPPAKRLSVFLRNCKSSSCSHEGVFMIPSRNGRITRTGR